MAGDHDELNRLLPAIDHTSKHFSEPLTVPGLARLCGYSERHLMRLFQVNPHRFLEQVRMVTAIDTLRRTSRPVASNAEECGFHDASAFVKRFKRFAGATPLPDRKKIQRTIRERRGMAIPERPATW